MNHVKSDTHSFHKNPDLHVQLALSCIDQLLACLSEEGTSKLWRAKGML